MPFSHRWLRVALFLALALASACSKHEAGSNAVASPSLTLTSLYSAIEADGESRTLLEARVQGSDGRPRAHVEVTFETNAGTLLKYRDERELLGEEPTSGEAVTDSNGIARAYLESSTMAGPATVTAHTERLADSTTVMFVPGPPAEVEVHAAPDNLTAGSGSQASVAVSVFDENRNLTDTVLSVEPPTNGSVDKLVVPTQRGTANFTYHAGDQPGEVTLTVEAANGITGQAPVTLISARVGSVGLEADPPTLVANGGGAESGRLTLTVSVFGPAGQPLEGVSPTVGTTLGTLLADPSNPAGQGSRVQAPPTDSSGRTQLALIAGVDPGTATVTATAGGRSATVWVPFSPGPPDHLRLRLSPTALPADGRSTADLSVTVLDAYDNPTDAQVTASAPSQGGVQPQSMTTIGGSGTFVYTAGTNPGPVVLHLETPEGISGEVTVNLLPVGSGSLSIASERVSLLADGGSTPAGRTTLTVTVLDGTGQAVAGAVVTLSTNLGTLDPLPPVAGDEGQTVRLAPTDARGKAQATLSAGTQIGQATVTAQAGARSGALQIPFSGGPPAQVRLSASPAVLGADGRSKATVVAAVFDANGVPTDTVVTIAYPAQGQVDRLFAPTVGGAATFTYTSGATPGDVVLRVTTSNGIAAQTTVRLQAPGP